MSIELTNLTARMQQLEYDCAAMRAESARIKRQFHTAQRRLRVQAGLAFSALMGAALFSPASRTAIAQGYGVTLATLNTRLLAVESKTQFQTADAASKSTTFSGCNLIVNDGGGSTSSIVRNAAGQGIGNLIIGYNALHVGSHNLILGDSNDYTSYGGIVAGENNTIAGPYACVTGGVDNTATGYFSFVSGGFLNTASGDYSSVAGGNSNTASDYSSFVSGGSSNMAGAYSSVTGGFGNVANGFYASVSGGQYNTSVGYASSVSGGRNITAGSSNGWAAGSYHSP